MNDRATEFSICDLYAPLKMETTRVWRTGQGGRELDKLLGEPHPTDSHFPEDWIMSTVEARNVGREDIEEGLSYLSDSNITLKSVLEEFPEKALGARHAAQVGNVPGVLAKIVDTSERTTIQVHPDSETAARLFHSPFGKTESWHVLGVRADAARQPGVYLGFKEGITREKWKQIFDAQDIPAMLDCMHYFPVKPGDTFLIRAGVPHAVSENFMFLEMQEPTDFTIRTERKTTSGFPVDDFLCHQGLGFDTMFDCFHYDGFSDEQAKREYMVPTRVLEQGAGYTRKEIVGYAQTNCFKLHRYEISAQCLVQSESVCSGLFVLSGKGVLISGQKDYDLGVGDQFFIPACCSDFELYASGLDPLVVFRCYGPQLK